jgi:hypothetical protein
MTEKPEVIDYYYYILQMIQLTHLMRNVLITAQDIKPEDGQ